MRVSGAVVSTFHARVAVAPTFPVVSVARTLNVWRPCGTLLTVRGDVHVAKAAVSRRHSNFATSVSREEKVKRALVDFVTAGGPPVIDVAGGPLSMVQRR